MRTKDNINRLTLRGWAVLEDLRGRIETSAKDGDLDSVYELIYHYVWNGMGAKMDLDSMSWMDIAELFAAIIEANQPLIQFPILTQKHKEVTMPWEYPGRTWYFWLHSFAKEYGWDEEKVGNLDIDTAIGLYQEITIDEQLKAEWEWGLTDLAYEYNQKTKRAVFHPLERPSWMQGIVRRQKPVTKKVKIRRDMLPVGNVVQLDEDEG